MISNDERREVATRLRDYERLREAFMESPLCAFLDALGVEGYIDWNGVIILLADLIDPEVEHTCKNLATRKDDFACSICDCEVVGCMVDNFGSFDNPLCFSYCPNCGAEVVDDD